MTRTTVTSAVFTALAPLLLASVAVAQSGNTNDVDKMFLHKSAQGSLAEIQMGKLALSKSHNHDVRAFAQKMIHDHTKIMQNMRPLGMKMGLSSATTLTAEDQLEMRKLRSLSGDAFNREYVSDMVDDHQKDLMSFKQEADSTSNPFLKKTVEEAGQVIQQHADLIDQLAKNNNINVPNH